MVKKISSVEISMALGGRILKRNFYFRVVRSLKSLCVTAVVRIKSKAGVDAAVGADLVLSVDGRNVFVGEVSSVSRSADEIRIDAVYRVCRGQDCNESFNGAGLDRVLAFMGVQTKYLAGAKSEDLIVCKGSVESTLKRLLAEMYYYTDIDGVLVVKDEESVGRNFVVDKCIYEFRGRQLHIFPIAELEINDTVQYNGVKYTVKDIVYDFGVRYKMILGV